MPNFARAGDIQRVLTLINKGIGSDSSPGHASFTPTRTSYVYVSGIPAVLRPKLAVGSRSLGYEPKLYTTMMSHSPYTR